MEPFRVGPDELFQMVVSVLAISFAFSVIFVGVDGMLAYPGELVAFLMLSLVTIGSGFILHEMGHKVAAIYYGAHAKFRMWVQGLAFMLITSFFGVLFAAPGAVYIYGNRIAPKENGIISLAGPITNLILIAIFATLTFILPMTQHFTTLHAWDFFGISRGAVNVWEFGMAINLILAMFNMIPAFPLDGSKVYAWKKSVWIGFTGVLFILALNLFPSMVLGFIILFLIAMIFSKLVFG
ncbi:TPA: site-2 protease family protein [Candidatus Micrarchaeota archaeon]|nr:site-2 protease family protein [Candidatus Micrarchaeota archaeon]